MKHYLSAFPRFSWLQLGCLLILGLMCAPLAVAALQMPHAGEVLACGSPFLLLRSPAEDGGEGGGGGDQGGKPPSIMGRLTTALSSNAALTAKIEGLEKANTAHEQAITAKDAEIVRLKARVTELEAIETDVNAALKVHENEVATLLAKEKDLDKLAEGKSKEQLAALGFPAGELPASNAAAGKVTTYAEALDVYGKIEDPIKAAAYYQNTIMPILAKAAA